MCFFLWIFVPVVDDDDNVLHRDNPVDVLAHEASSSKPT